MTLASLKTMILPKLLSGTRDGLPLDTIGATDALQALALSSQALRFDRPRHPTDFLVENAINGLAPIMPDAARKALLRLFSGKSQPSAHLCAAIVRKLAETNFRLHPFDLPRLEPFVKSHAEGLGTEAVAFCERETPVAQKQNYFAPDALNDENWMLATPAVKVGYIRARRTSHPEAARCLVEATWSKENADSRVRLLEVFRTRLSLADAPFLKSLENDRAPRVRELAQRLLFRLPGFEGDNPALRAALDRIKISKGGLIFKKTGLAVELPATVRDQARFQWLYDTFGPVGLETLAKASSMSVDALITASEKQLNMLVALLFMATQDKRLDVVKSIADRHLDEPWTAFIALDAEILGDYDLQEKLAWTALVFPPDRWAADTPPLVIQALEKFLGDEVSEAFMRKIIGSKLWQVVRGNNGLYIDTSIFDSLAIICPAAMRPALRAELSAIDAAKSGNAILYLDLKDNLETAHV